MIMTAFQFFIGGENERTVLKFKAFENMCMGGAVLDIEMTDNNGNTVKVEEIPEWQIRQLAAYLNATLTERRL